MSFDTIGTPSHGQESQCGLYNPGLPASDISCIPVAARTLVFSTARGGSFCTQPIVRSVRLGHQTLMRACPVPPPVVRRVLAPVSSPIGASNLHRACIALQRCATHAGVAGRIPACVQGKGDSFWTSRPDAASGRRLCCLVGEPASVSPRTWQRLHSGVEFATTTTSFAQVARFKSLTYAAYIGAFRSAPLAVLAMSLGYSDAVPIPGPCFGKCRLTQAPHSTQAAPRVRSATSAWDRNGQEAPPTRCRPEVERKRLGDIKHVSPDTLEAHQTSSPARPCADPPSKAVPRLRDQLDHSQFERSRILPTTHKCYRCSVCATRATSGCGLLQGWAPKPYGGARAMLTNHNARAAGTPAHTGAAATTAMSNLICRAHSWKFARWHVRSALQRCGEIRDRLASNAAGPQGAIWA